MAWRQSEFREGAEEILLSFVESSPQRERHIHQTKQKVKVKKQKNNKEYDKLDANEEVVPIQIIRNAAPTGDADEVHR